MVFPLFGCFSIRGRGLGSHSMKRDIHAQHARNHTTKTQYRGTSISICSKQHDNTQNMKNLTWIACPRPISFLISDGWPYRILCRFSTYVHSSIQEIHGHFRQTFTPCMTTVSHILDPGETWVISLHQPSKNRALVLYIISKYCNIYYWCLKLIFLHFVVQNFQNYLTERFPINCSLEVMHNEYIYIFNL